MRTAAEIMEGPWRVWQLADDSDAYGSDAGRCVLVTTDGEDEVPGFGPMDESEANRIAAFHNVAVALDRFDAVEVHAMQRLIEHMGDSPDPIIVPFDERPGPGDVVHCWSVLGHLKTGGTDDICDCRDEVTALAIATALEALIPMVRGLKAFVTTR